jgi:hypothetical protein
MMIFLNDETDEGFYKETRAKANELPKIYAIIWANYGCILADNMRIRAAYISIPGDHYGPFVGRVNLTVSNNFSST